MQIVNLLFSSVMFLVVSISSGAQTSIESLMFDPTPPKYSQCAAILFDGKVLVDDYSPRGICKLETGMKGKLSVATVNLSCRGNSTPINNIGFKVAIQNERTKTMWMYSDQMYMEVPLEEVLEKCEPGDRIIILTVGQQFSLPHNEIEIMGGC